MMVRSVAVIAAMLLFGRAASQQNSRCLTDSGDGSANADCIGVALSGGGTKAASVAMGVLTGLAEADVLGKVDAISSVSGGSYAAYYYFSKLRELQRVRDNGEIAGVQSEAKFFHDCIPLAYLKQSDTAMFTAEQMLRLEWKEANADDGIALFGKRFCAMHHRDLTGESSEADRKLARKRFEPFRFQTHVRCHQDVFEGSECKFETTREEDNPASSVLPMAGATAATLIPFSETLSPLTSVHHFARTLFDWPVNLSPSRLAYRHGIGVSFGLFPRTLEHLSQSAPCSTGLFTNCDPNAVSRSVDDSTFRLADLQNLHKTGVEGVRAEAFKVPLWFINSTATPSRSIFGWATQSQLNTRRDAFEFHPYGYGSAFYERKDAPMPPSGMEEASVLDAVNVSAAFLDANLLSVPQPLRFGAALGLHALNGEWGLDIPNYNVGDQRRVIHSLLPFPLYYMDGFFAKLSDKSGKATLWQDTKFDSAWIRLIDGGQSENLGAYALIRRGYGYVLIADGAQDNKGHMEDLCNLRLQLLEHHDWHLVVPGLEKFDQVCRQWLHLVDSRDSTEDSAAQQSGEFNNSGRARALYRIQSNESAPQPGDSAVDGPLGYLVRKWKYPFLVGCVLNKAGDTPLSDEAKANQCVDGDRRSWVVIVKPAFDAERFAERQIEKKTGRVKSCGGECEVPCETSAYLMWNRDARNPESREAVFPQNSTLSMTLDSSYTRYGAYKDLMRSHTVAALKSTLAGQQPNDSGLKELLDRQGKDPIRPNPDPDKKRVPCGIH